ncbi:MAG: hypothetical protein KUF77_15395 [Candidatus Thiodiazotropha sp. (ex Lucina aurantia)]|uniref:Uncharacterized protein n=1 Tax=Candidatus Thiodiazotropha taylori TaxID=2792791 RepID=A0A9E4NHV9_9GAMM|nr:hypothetical protein [Candidatus Thiodiazotropha sp. (ex Lucina pensylvanica)]MBV2099526.1 hypothetical protein [Candidatus Thiodiazotropha sp. (ex Codakia orbicularis)]MBV2104409.1 hypothetical protein [Candidatus Thiodiazotropha sp. (ex Lucina aurantia)]MBV2125798.1 hypothetical protein [Candidatus Thiodiazotropha taylori]MCW4235713.1 hypothetical protein [Candidatus Thiodiazotropha endolucinida]
MYQAFKAMPTLLKFITAHALFCFMFFMAVVILGIPITFKGELMEFYDLWEGGLPTAAMGLSMPVAGVLLLKRWQYARYIYSFLFISVMVAPYVYWQQLPAIIFGIIFSCGIIGYLFLNRSAREYFSS